MRDKIRIIIFLLFISVRVFGQDCFETDLKIREVETESQHLDIVVFFENDSIKKICWWKKGTFSAEVYNGKESIRTQIIKSHPIEYKAEDITYRGHVLESDIYISGQRIEFYTLCE